MINGVALLDALAVLDPEDALAVNAFNLAAFLYVRAVDAPRSGRFLMAEKDGAAVLVPRAPEMHCLPDLRQRIVVEALKRGERL